MTGLQVYCNNKFGFSADETLKMVQKLYEMKVVTYPRVDTTFLPNDIYPKVKGILLKLSNYSKIIKPLLEKKIKKSKRVFDDDKVTDHHAIIPTGIQENLQYNQQQVYDIITRRFIGVFYPDSNISNTSVIGKASNVNFKTNGKEIITRGWRLAFETEETKIKEENSEQHTLPTFINGEKGKHEPSFLEKETKPPRNFTEASLLRSMETAGRHVDDDEMRELMKENGIGRPSTRANIIETLFRRKYIERKKKLVVATQTGIDLIDIIDNDLLKSAELTGRWEKRLKEIERGEFNAGTFIDNMKKMVDELVYEVRANKTIRRISSNNIIPIKKNETKKTNNPGKKDIIGKTCPKCNKGKLIKGSSAYGCSEYKNNCNLKIPFKIIGKKVSVNQMIRLIEKGCTTNLKGFKSEYGFVEGLIRFDKDFSIQLEPKKKIEKKYDSSEKLVCPKCKKGEILKGKIAYGCSNYKIGCDFIFSFENIKKIANGKPLTKEFVINILLK